MRKIIALIAIISSIFIASSVIAQESDSPSEIDIALQTLSTALNTPITQDMLDYVYWSEVTFTSTALGCPTPGQVYDPINITGYQITLVYEGVTYDYRVTTGAEYVVLCSTSDAPFVVPVTPEPVVIATAIEPTVDTNNTCPNALLPRLTIGETARTTPEIGSNIRELPDLNATDIGTIEPSDTFVVVDGPVCGPQGNYWWQVQYQQVGQADLTIGWTVEGLDGLYFIEPIPQPLVGTTDTINANTALDVVPLGEIEGNLLGIAAWSPDGQMIAIADASTARPAIWIYFVADLTQVPVLIEVSFDTTALEFSPDGSLLAIGAPDGTVYLLNLSNYTIIHSFVAHDTAVLDIDFSPNGQYMLVMDDNYTAHFYGVVTP